jgi:site-specific DNA-methyltransferase (adenine-specific)
MAQDEARRVSEHRIIEGDCREAMRALPDNSVDLIATDPPYFKVKGEAWDRQWDKPSQFLDWLDTIAAQWQRILKPNGSLYCFASPQMRARVEVTIAKRFNCLPSITWVKGESHCGGWHAQASKESLRAFFPRTEAIIFAEHHGADNIAKGAAGYIAKCDELRGFVFEPLRAYIAGEFDRAGMLNAAGKIAANVACGFSPSAGGMASRHYFSRSQWQLPTAEHYEAMRRLLNAGGGDYLRREYEDLRREYEDLRREYEDLRREYEDLRRPFSVTADVPYTDVWTFPTVQHYRGKHPCEKPLAMMRHIVAASSKPGAVVLDCFAGSGTTGVAAASLGREFIGMDLDPRWCNVARARIAAVAGSGCAAEFDEERESDPRPAPRPAATWQASLFDEAEQA